MLVKWTEKSLHAFKKEPRETEELKKVMAGMGVQVKSWYVLMGQYDEMCILKAPNAEAVARLIFPLRARYGAQTETLQAFSDAEAVGLFAGMK